METRLPSAFIGALRSAYRQPHASHRLLLPPATITTAHHHLHTTSSSRATPIAHPTVAGPPPSAPLVSASHPPERVQRKKLLAELQRKSQSAPINPSKPATALQKRFWREVSVAETPCDNGAAPATLQILLDKRPVRTADRRILNLPLHKRHLATAIAIEWDQLVTAQQALKQHYIPLTSLTSRALDIAAADASGDEAGVRAALVAMFMRYLSTDTLLCWAPEQSIHDPQEAQFATRNLRARQRTVAEPIIAYLTTHIFPGIDIVPILAEDSIVPIPQPQISQDVIRRWITDLPAWELAALERGVLATKSLLVAARLLVAWSSEWRHLRTTSAPVFGVDQAAEAATLEVMHQVEQWGEVEDTHDVEREDLRRQLGSVVLLVS